jgi:nicotinate-nucleotide adenylyltransferase
MVGRGRHLLSGQRWGILGGTFDPPHYGHLVIAQQTRESLGLAGVLFMPAAQPPHKPDLVIGSPVHRRSMVELAIKGNPGFSLLTIELDRGGTSYTVDSLEALTRSMPADRFVLIVSVEAARQLPQWREPGRILELAEIAVVPRLGYPPLEPDWAARAFPGLEGRFQQVDSPSLGHSASDIRARVAKGRSIRYLVPPAVEDYIGRYRLYR